MPRYSKKFTECDFHQDLLTPKSNAGQEGIYTISEGAAADFIAQPDDVNLQKVQGRIEVASFYFSQYQPLSALRPDITGLVAQSSVLMRHFDHQASALGKVAAGVGPMQPLLPHHYRSESRRQTQLFVPTLPDHTIRADDGLQTQLVAFLRAQFGERVLTTPTVKSPVIAGAALANQTLLNLVARTFSATPTIGQSNP